MKIEDVFRKLKPVASGELDAWGYGKSRENRL
jgi:hypothetical protein